MKDTERLNLIKEVAGTRVYDERRKESIKIMQQTDLKSEKIESSIKTIEEKLKELEEETKEYTEYQNLDKKKRCIEYTIYNTELKEASKNFDDIEKSRIESVKSASELHNDAINSHEKIKKLSRDIKEYQTELNEHQKELTILNEERQELIKKKAKVVLEIKDLQLNEIEEKDYKVNFND
jgi:structural maintenance of chromosome 3 (chondroitin sulfate proteoglycan 6)